MDLSPNAAARAEAHLPDIAGLADQAASQLGDALSAIRKLRDRAEAAGAGRGLRSDDVHEMQRQLVYAVAGASRGVAQLGDVAWRMAGLQHVIDNDR